MHRQLIANRIVENDYEMYKNKLLYNSLRSMKPATNTNWFRSNNWPFQRKSSLLEVKNRNRMNGFVNIAQENIKFYKKLVCSKSNYNHKKYIKNFDKSQFYSGSLKKFRETQMPLIYNSKTERKLNLSNNEKYQEYNNEENIVQKDYNIPQIIKSNSQNNVIVNNIKNNNEQPNFNLTPYFCKKISLFGLGDCLVEIIIQKLRFMIIIKPQDESVNNTYAILFKDQSAIPAFKSYEDILSSIYYSGEQDLVITVLPPDEYGYVRLK